MKLELIKEHCPEGWQSSVLGKESKVSNNLRFPISTAQRKYMQGSYPYYGPTKALDYINEYRVEGTYVLISEDGDHFLKYREVPMTLLVSGKFNVNNHAHLIQGTDRCLTRWIYYFYTHTSLQTHITRQGAGRFKLTQDALLKLPILVPPVREQEIVIEILSQWDMAIEQTKKLITAKVIRKRGLMQQLLTGKKRFAEFGKDNGAHLTKFGAMPNDWAYVSIEDIAHEVSTKNGNGKKLTVLSCSKHRGLVRSLEYFGKQVFSEDTSTYKVVKRNQFAYATNHIEEGSIGYQNICDEALISPMYTVFETCSSVDDSFFYKLLKTELYRHIFEVNTSASVDRRGSLRWKEFSKIKVALPSLEEQRRIAAVIETCDQEIELLRKQLAALKRQKRGLMQKLLTGQIRVKVAQEAAS